MSTLPGAWYGADLRWRPPMEATARSEYGDALTVTETRGRYGCMLTYRASVDVHGPGDLVEVVIVFFEYPPYDCYGLAPSDYPRVWAEPGATSPHRMPDDGALCLWYPFDPPQHRWTADKGLLDLIDIVVDHLLCEAFWRSTGGWHGGVWPGDEADHGVAQGAA